MKINHLLVEQVQVFQWLLFNKFTLVSSFCHITTTDLHGFWRIAWLEQRVIVQRLKAIGTKKSSIIFSHTLTSFAFIVKEWIPKAWCYHRHVSQWGCSCVCSFSWGQKYFIFRLTWISFGGVEVTGAVPFISHLHATLCWLCYIKFQLNIFRFVLVVWQNKSPHQHISFKNYSGKVWNTEQLFYKNGSAESCISKISCSGITLNAPKFKPSVSVF